MKCRDFLSMVSDYLDGMVGAADLRRFEAHATTCARCRQVLEHVRTIDRLAQSGRAEAVPETFTDDVMRRISQAQPSVSPPTWVRRRLWAGALAAAVLVGIAAWLALMTPRSEPPFVTGGSTQEVRPPIIVLLATYWDTKNRIEEAVKEGEAAARELADSAYEWVSAYPSTTLSLLEFGEISELFGIDGAALEEIQDGADQGYQHLRDLMEGTLDGLSL